jgi:hypothetical protein
MNHHLPICVHACAYHCMRRLEYQPVTEAEPEFVNVYGAQESILPAYVAWWAGTSNRVVESFPGRTGPLGWESIPGLLKGLQIRAQSSLSFVRSCFCQDQFKPEWETRPSNSSFQIHPCFSWHAICLFGEVCGGGGGWDGLRLKWHILIMCLSKGGRQNRTWINKKWNMEKIQCEDIKHSKDRMSCLMF